MKTLLAATSGLLLSLLPVRGETLTLETVTTLETAANRQIPGIRAALVKVGRISLPDLRPGVILNESGHILCPYLRPIDGVAVPYLTYGENDFRSAAETIWEDEKTGLAIIKSDTALSDKKRPVKLASEDSLQTCSWLIAPGYPPAVLPDDAVQLHLGHLLTAPTKSDQTFTIQVRSRTGGLPLFDLAGRLAGISAKRLSAGSGFSAFTIADLIDRVPELSEYMPPEEIAPLPRLPYYLVEESEEKDDRENSSDSVEPELPADPARDALGDYAAGITSEVPTVAIFNHAGVNTSGIHGLIISADGMILTKASEIGATPIVHFRDESYPAVLLATDEATDLALLSIEADQLPSVQWADVEPVEGTLLHSPHVHTAPPFDLATTSGFFSHRLKKHPAASLTVHSPEQITSLGIIPEHDESTISIAAILPGSPAAKAKLNRGDILVSLDGTSMPNRNALRDALSNREVGDVVSLGIRRDGKEQSISLTLGSAHLRLPVTEPMIGENSTNMIITPPSIRRSGFPETLVHDLVIEHWQNGSPICDSRGRVLGINIATVTYDRTLALPVSTIRKAIDRMLNQPVSF